MEWISVNERLPNWLEDVLCRVMEVERGGSYTVRYRVLHITEPKGRDWDCRDMIVTHWMPLPEPPKDVTK